MATCSLVLRSSVSGCAGRTACHASRACPNSGSTGLVKAVPVLCTGTPSSASPEIAAPSYCQRTQPQPRGRTRRPPPYAAGGQNPPHSREGPVGQLRDLAKRQDGEILLDHEGVQQVEQLGAGPGRCGATELRLSGCSAGGADRTRQ